MEATLTDASRPLQAMEQLRRRFPHALLLSFATPPPGLAVLGDGAARGTRRTDRELATEFLTAMRGADPADDELALLHQAVDACCEDTDVDTLLSAGSQSDPASGVGR